MLPATLASAMPRPTYPANMGSCPLPPPVTIATLLETGASRRTTACIPGSLRKYCGKARASPSIACSATSSGLLISFFTWS